MNNCRVLLADDEAAILEGYKLLFDWEKYQCEIAGTAMDGQEAVEKARELKPDIVITDIKMPIMDGLKLSEEIRNQYPNIKVMLVTAYDDIRFAQEAMRAGAVDFILKPLKRQEMREALVRIGNKVEKNENSETIEQIKDYLEKHYTDSTVSLTSVAEVFFLNPSYLSRIFKQKTGITFIDYLNEVRIQHACDYLLRSDLKIFEIAEKVGIPNPDYFGKCFRKKMGVSIKEYRKGKKSAEKSKEN